MLGEDAESDYSLRTRFAAAREGQGSCKENSIRAALVRVETVTSVAYGTTLELPVIPEKEGHTIDGWYNGENKEWEAVYL